MTTTSVSLFKRTILIAASATVSFGLVSPAMASAASTVPSASSTIGHVAMEQSNGRDGVYVHVKNRSTKQTIWVKNRKSGVPRQLAPGASTAFDKDFTSVSDEVELTVQIPGQREFEIDASNPTIGWPNVTVDGDNENYAQWEERFFAVDDTRVAVHRHNDQDDRKRFFLEITPPGALN